MSADPQPDDGPSPAEIALRARVASYGSWARTSDRTARTQPGRDAMRAKFERDVDPDGALPPEERRAKAEAARKAFYAGLALKSAQARRRKRARRNAA